MRYWGLRAFAGFALALLFLLVTLQARAQTPSSLTPEQLQAFQNLPPEQQKAIMDAIAKPSSTPGTVDSIGGAEEADRTRSTVRTNGERRQSVTEPGRRSSKENQSLPGPPRMGPQSTVLISVELTASKKAPEQSPMELPEATKKLLEDRRAHILAGNPYRLNEAQRLQERWRARLRGLKYAVMPLVSQR
jgi:hypothetical protein